MVTEQATAREAQECPPEANQPRSIFLFSDGTGNSSAKLFKTNVWRMYEALELGPPLKKSDRVQIAYYDNGVGTSNFKPLQLLGGVFGFGLKGGVLRLYRYLCRNYRDGDTIYAFGFSRGAFTIRLLVGLITSQGLVQGDDEADLALQARAAYRELCRNAWPNKRLARDLAWDLRKYRDRFINWKRRRRRQRDYDSVTKLHPDIQFVGVWDTVAAYGGPFAEITRGIDDWVWPLTMPNYALSTKVLRASHALALDDERDAFLPLLWDEVREQELVTQGELAWAHDGSGKEVKKAKRGRLSQVWFSGMHSDVGGGYPDESLSYVSLLWMMDEASNGLPADMAPRFLPRMLERARTFANPYGPMHNSRDGVAAYYRYQPRKIAAWLKDAGSDTLALRDPESPGRDKDWKRLPDRGLLKTVVVHESAIARIVSGTDRYAPIAIPDSFGTARSGTGPYAPPYLSDHSFNQLSSRGAQKKRARMTEAAWDQVWWRRKVYFFSVFLLLALLLFPLLAVPNPLDDLCSDDRCFAARPIRWIGQFVPKFVSPWTGGFARQPVLFLSLVGFIALSLAWGKSLAGSIHDRSWRLWNDARSMKPSGAKLAVGRLQDIRARFAYQWGLNAIRWHILPAISGALTWLILIYAAAAVTTQLYLIVDETRARHCDTKLERRTDGAVLMRLNELCTSLGVSVQKEKSYLLTLQVDKEWKDKGPQGGEGYKAGPDSAPDLPWYLDIPGQPFRRIIGAGWLEPAIRTRWDRRLIGKGASISRLTLKPITDRPFCFGGEFEAKRDGELDIFVNDVRVPLDERKFYKFNEGSAWVTVKPGVDDGTGNSFDCN